MPRKNYGKPNQPQPRGKASSRRGIDNQRLVAGEMRACGFPRAARSRDKRPLPDLRDTGRYRIRTKLSTQVYASPTLLDEIPIEPGTVPIIVSRVDYRPPVAILPWSDLQRLIRFRETGSEDPIIPTEPENGTDPTERDPVCPPSA